MKKTGGLRRKTRNLFKKHKRQKGKCYEVLIIDRGKQKTLIVHPVHLKKD